MNNSMDRTLTIVLMDPPYESANTTTAFRIIASALRKKIKVNVFAYEGAVSLSCRDQMPHANPVKGTTIEEEQHPITSRFVAALFDLARDSADLNWVNCGLCVDERGANNSIDGVKRGSPADFLRMAKESTNTLVIPTK